MNNRAEMPILGEPELVRRLTDKIGLKNLSMLKGVGDDAAVLDYTDKQVSVTTNLLLGDTHFDLMHIPLKHFGYKSAVVNFSDTHATNGCPERITVSLDTSKRLCTEGLEESYEGIRLACDVYDVDLVGGDTSASRTGLAISTTYLGEGEKGKAVCRNGVKETDLICVPSDLGAACIGLQPLEREKSIFNGERDFTPDLFGKGYLLRRQLKPEVRKDIVEVLNQAGTVPTSMMNISDGPSSELLHTSKESSVGCRAYEDCTPVDYQTAAMAEQFNTSLVAAALNGGGNYELSFTVPLADHNRVSGMKDIKVTDHIIKSELGSYFIGRGGSEVELKAQGWNSLN